MDHIEFDPARASDSAPFQSGEWRMMIYRFDLADSIHLQDWIPVLNALAAHLLRTPVHLAHLKLSDVSDLAGSSPVEQPVLLLRQESSIQTGGPKPTPSGDHPMISQTQLESSFRGKRLNRTIVAKAREASMSMIGLPSEFDGLFQTAKIRKLGETPHAAGAIPAFLITGAQLGLLSQVQDSMSSLADGIQGYGPFCDLLGAPYLPTSADIVRNWAALFAPGRTFGMYVSLLAKACHLMGYSAEWRSPALAGAATGLANAMDMIPKYDKYTNRTSFRRVMTAEAPIADFGKFMYLSMLYAIRGPSGELPAQRPPLATRLDTNVVQSEKAPRAFGS